MKHRVLLQLGIPLLILCALFLLLAYPADRTLRPQPLLEVSVILRETDVNLWTNARQGMEQAAMDLDVELRFLTPAEDNDAAQQAELLDREASGRRPGGRAGTGGPGGAGAGGGRSFRQAAGGISGDRHDAGRCGVLCGDGQ